MNVIFLGFSPPQKVKNHWTKRMRLNRGIYFWLRLKLQVPYTFFKRVYTFKCKEKLNNY